MTIPAFDAVNCNLDAIGVAVDKDSLGLVVPNPNVLRRALHPDADGTTMSQALWAIEECYGWTLADRWVTPSDLTDLLDEKRGALVHVVRQPLGDLCHQPFDGTHAIYVQQHREQTQDVLLYDPLCPTAHWFPWSKIVIGGVAFGALVGHPGRIHVALTRPGRGEPRVSRQGRVLALPGREGRHHGPHPAHQRRLLGADRGTRVAALAGPQPGAPHPAQDRERRLHQLVRRAALRQRRLQRGDGMKADDVKLWFTYGLATLIVVGGGAMLFVSRNEANTDFALLIAGFIGTAVGWVFNRESATQATRAAQSSAAQAAQGQP